VDLPEGTAQCATIGCDTDSTIGDPHEEYWRYSAPYDDVVAFLQKQFATGRQYDSHGATRWDGLPPCYNTNHQSPPWGWTYNDQTAWEWSDGATRLAVSVDKPGFKTADGHIRPFGWIATRSWAVDPDESGSGPPCYRA
jgi:hypothetical protein